MSLKAMPLNGTFWREFYDRPTLIYFLAHPQGEAHFRDVVSLMEISRVFPHGLTHMRFCPVIPGKTTPESPAPGEGIIILGRPEHFQSDFIQKRIIDNLFPPLRMTFASNDPKEEGYRTLSSALMGEAYTCTRAQGNGAHKHLNDFALVYYGQARPYESEETVPCLILSGTSTLGTWGASVFATSPHLLEQHVGYSPWYQGVLNVAVELPTPGAPFLRHNLALHVEGPFFRARSVKVVYPKGKWRKKADFQIFIDGQPLAKGRDKWCCFLAFALAQQEHQDRCVQLKEIASRLRGDFDCPKLSEEGYPLATRLSEIWRTIRKRGVYMEQTSPGYRLLLAGFEEIMA